MDKGAGTERSGVPVRARVRNDESRPFRGLHLIGSCAGERPADKGGVEHLAAVLVALSGVVLAVARLLAVASPGVRSDGQNSAQGPDTRLTSASGYRFNVESSGTVTVKCPTCHWRRAERSARRAMTAAMEHEDTVHQLPLPAEPSF